MGVSIVVGLGNPGGRYARTRHNVGFMVVDRLADSRAGQWSECGASTTLSQIASVEIGGAPALLVKPQTFMNASGRAVIAVCAERAFEPGDLLVVFDDFNLAFGRLRLRRNGSDGGHNGLASVIHEVCSEEIPRLRVGIGPLPREGDDIDYVLSGFGPDEDVVELVDRGCRAVEHCIADGIDAAMNQFNGCAPI